MDKEKKSGSSESKGNSQIITFFALLIHSVKSIVLMSVAVVLAVVMIVANVVLNHYSLIINRFLVGDTADASGAGAQGALADADLVVRDAAEESMVLLKIGRAHV